MVVVSFVTFLYSFSFVCWSDDDGSRMVTHFGLFLSWISLLNDIMLSLFAGERRTVFRFVLFLYSFNYTCWGIMMER